MTADTSQPDQYQASWAILLRSDLELASSSSGLQLSGTTSPPSGSKPSRGRGRGRTRGRGSVRVTASDRRAGQIKDEQDDNQAAAAQSIPDVSLLHDTQATVALPNKAEAASGEAEMPQAVTDDSQPAQDSIALGTDEACKQEHADAPGNSNQQTITAAAAAPQHQNETMPDVQQQVAPMTMPTASVALKRSETFVEEDDYDADD